MELYTIGFTQKSAKEFFETLKSAGINTLIDVRLNNKSQLAGFAKGRDLPYLMREICGAVYKHEENFAPTKDLLDDWKNGKISWQEYEQVYIKTMDRRKVAEIYGRKYLDDTLNGRVCFLCSEATPENCHRRLLAEYLREKMPELAYMGINHL